MYSSEHPEGVEELKGWYWKKFEVLFEAYLKRRAVQDARDHKNAMVSGLWSNSNFDDNKSTREKALKDIENTFLEAVTNIYNGSSNEEYEVSYDQGIMSGIPDDLR